MMENIEIIRCQLAKNNISEGNDYYCYYYYVYEKIKDFGNVFGQAHSACNI